MTGETVGNSAKGKKLRVRIVSDGKEVKAKPFVQEIVAKTVLGLIAVLRGAENPQRLEITIERS